MQALAILALLVLCLSCTPASSRGAKPGLPGLLDRPATAFLRDPRVHSLSIGVYRNGRYFTKHYGELLKGHGRGPTDASRYELGSVTKVFTGTLAAQAVLDGKVGLNDDVRSYLDRKYPNLEFNGAPVRFRHLLTHTSNFPNFPIKGDTKSSFFDGLAEININTKPGTHYSYSNTAPELTAFILERVYNTPYDTLLREKVLDPYNMTETTFDTASLIRGYNGDGKLMPNFDRKLWGGTVGLNSTVNDLMKFAKMQLERTDGAVGESHRVLYRIDETISIGYHWYRHKEDGVVSFRHHGGIYGMQNWLILYPSHRIAISVLSNASFDGIGNALEKLVDSIFGSLVSRQ